MKHTIQVCGRCNFTKTAEEKEGVRGGALLYDNLMKKFEKWPHKEAFNVERTGCMGACEHSCVVAFQGPGKVTWVFGGLNPKFSVSGILEFAEKYLADERGKVAYSERPPELAAGLLVRVPPTGSRYTAAVAVAAASGKEDVDCA